LPSDIRIIHAHEFLKATPDGRLDPDETKRVLVEIATASAPSNDYDILLDTRGAQSELTVTELLDLAAELHSVRKVFSRKSAILVPRQRLDHAEFFAALARDRGFDAAAFISLGDAMAWLLDVPDSE